MIATWIVSLTLVGLSGILLDMHRRSWRAAEHDEAMSPAARRFALSQYRRRMQSSGIIGALGLAIAIWPVVPHEPWTMALYLASIGGACLAITVLAVLDAWATRQHFARVHAEQLAAHLKLAREMSRDDG